MEGIDRVFDDCLLLSNDHNDQDMYHWINERKFSHSDGKYLSALKTDSVHFVCYQNGSLYSQASPRVRLGLWDFETQHISSLSIEFNGVSDEFSFNKYVRGLGYIYRQYSNFERIDYIARGKSMLGLHLRSVDVGTFKITINILHEKAWPEKVKACKYETTKDARSVTVQSELTTTKIIVEGTETCAINVNKTQVTLTSTSSSIISVYVSCDGSEPNNFDFKSALTFHRSVEDYCILKTPSFKINKLFLWAKHDLLELFTPTPIGSGFYAGIPQFSWFFGRDGEWMSMAAIECGLDDLAKKQLELLYSFSKGGRIPHEIPLSNHGNIGSKNYQIGSVPVNTQFMSIDSSPLWIITEYQLSAWTGTKPSYDRVEKVLQFCLSCDKDGDGLLENRFSEGLIGWPETWAEKRDGICIDVNAWWLEAMRLCRKNFYQVSAIEKKAIKSYTDIFFSAQENTFPPDSVLSNERREIKGAMQIVPAIYSSSETMKTMLDQLSGEDVIVPWGVRSVSSLDDFYDGGYHTGTVWPLMTGWMTLAMYNNGMKDRAFKLLESFTDLAFSSLDPGRINETYNPDFLVGQGQFFQGWSSSLFIQSVLEGLLGFQRIPDSSSIRECVHPRTPAGWGPIIIKKMKFKGGLYDLKVEGENLTELSDRGVAHTNEEV